MMHSSYDIIITDNDTVDDYISMYLHHKHFPNEYTKNLS